MDFEHYMSLSFRQGKEEGAHQKAIENAQKLLAGSNACRLLISGGCYDVI